MKYALLLYPEEAAWNELGPEAQGAIMGEYATVDEQMRGAGVYRGGDGLQPSATATTVRVRNGERILSDGPFTETREVLGGLYFIDCDTLDEALDWAARLPDARLGSVEVRPVLDYAALGIEDPNERSTG